ncbi:fibronectin type III domain-containing protein [Dactylosporangium fulvum]|uniref:Fibronectin type III domain-containing protein n=1 Tax=Dactylosporangium fulvum TaxID=53359 RepID=A0ABY5W5C6_9ACTN|nr:fibronectin type III domain-containing protein [Dactylosporangium fulvum]UWP84575.1 fibronectin type III domain-containing protein [Dactylosporangium fulvum]
MVTMRLRSRKSGGLVTVSTIVGLVAVLGLTLFGTGAANNAVASFDVSSWLWSNDKGEVARVNGVTGKVDTRTKITDAQGHTMQVSQSDRFVILRDLNTGKISVLDLSSLTLGATTQSTPGLGVTVAVHDDVAFIVDAVQGLVRQLDPATLLPVGETLTFPPGISGGAFDDSGRLWLLVPSEGTVVAVKPSARRPSASAGGQGGGQAGSADPSIVKTVGVADPSHDLTLSILDTGVAVLDKTSTTLTTLRGDAVRKVPLRMAGNGAMPQRTVGGDVPVTVVDDRHVYVVNGDKVADFTVPGDSPQLQPCVAWSGRFYCADDSSGTVYVLDAQGKALDPIKIQAGGKALELEVREDRMFINAPGGSTARVVDEQHQVRTVDKYANDVVGGDAPPVPPPPPPAKPPVGPPGAPPRVTATAGDAQARVTWTAAPANGSAVTKYVVEGDGKVHEVGASQRSLDITGLTNGQTYKFTVYAVNAKGNGPKRAANPVVPTSEVPDPPVSVAAAANPDGTVTVTWPAANGQGHKIARYVVTSVSTGESKTFESGQPTLTVPAGELTYGTQVAFRVASINDIGASSAQSPLSPSVVPFNKPTAPGGLTVKAVATKRGTVVATWRAPQDNGAPITGYEATVNGQKQTLGTGLTHEFGGFGDAEHVTVQLRAVNKAGPGAPASGAADTLAQPKMTVDTANSTAALNSITVRFTATDGGGAPARCRLDVAGAGATEGACSGSLTMTGLWPATAYNYTVTVTNAAGMTADGTGSLTTPTYRGTVVCTVTSYCGRGAPNGGIWVYRTPSQNGTAVGDVYAPDSYVAICQTNTGTSINAEPYGGKRSTVWIKIQFQGENYIPYAWFNLPNGTGPLKQC